MSADLSTPVVSSPPTRWAGPCAQDPESWDLDSGGLVQWLAARRACDGCPVITQCRELMAEAYPQANARRPAFNPKSVIWAGVAYSESGRVLTKESMARLAALRRNRAAAEAAQAASHVVAGSAPSVMDWAS